MPGKSFGFEAAFPVRHNLRWFEENEMKKIVVGARIASVLLVILIAASCAWAQTAPMVADKDAAARIAWWRDAKFGLFMHWGVYSIPGRGEWVQWQEQIPVDEYAKLKEQFHPDHFDPGAWAEIAKAAGMKYAVLTARHHDGFALFDDPGSDFTSMNSVAHHDFVADYVKAVRKAGLRVGLYYSPLDWRYPGFFFPGIYKPNAEQLRDQYHRQLNELASHYGKLDILWFDGGGGDWLGFGGVNFKGGWKARPKGEHYSGPFNWRDQEAVNNLRQSQPSIIINDRTDAAADFRSREGDGRLGDFENGYPWELCTTLTEGAWGYVPGAKIKTLDHLIRLLVSAGATATSCSMWVPVRMGKSTRRMRRACARWERGSISMARVSTRPAAVPTCRAISESRRITTRPSICTSSILPARRSHCLRCRQRSSAARPLRVERSHAGRAMRGSKSL